MEFLWAVINNVKGFLIAGAVISGIATIGLLVAWAIASDFASEYGGKQDISRASTFRRLFPKSAAVCVVFSLLSCVPTINELWTVRIALIKYELASPENVKQAAETIERIGKKLECKYLGGCEEPKK